MMEHILVLPGLVLFVVVAWQVGRVLNWFRHLRFTREWQPLIDVIGGTVHEDPQGGGATSWLVGSWKEHVIQASMTPQVRSFEWQHHENRFSVGVAGQRGAASWRAELSPGVGSRFEVQSDDAGLIERLERSDAERLMREAECTVARFDRHSELLFVDENPTPALIPSRERFVRLLDVATGLARIQDVLNAGHTHRSS